MKNSAQKNPLLRTITVITLLSVLATGCGSTKEKDQQYTIANFDNILPTKVHTITATGQSDIGALNDAANAAASFCAANKGHAEFLDHITKYKGITDKQKHIIVHANTALNTSNSVFSNRDYNVTLRFKCLSPRQEKYLAQVTKQMADDNNKAKKAE